MRNRSGSREEARSAKKRTDSSLANPIGLDKSESGAEAATYWKRVRSSSEVEVSTFVYQNMYRLSLNLFLNSSVCISPQPWDRLRPRRKVKVKTQRRHHQGSSSANSFGSNNSSSGPEADSNVRNQSGIREEARST